MMVHSRSLGGLLSRICSSSVILGLVALGALLFFPNQSYGGGAFLLPWGRWDGAVVGGGAKSDVGGGAVRDSGSVGLLGGTQCVRRDIWRSVSSVGLNGLRWVLFLSGVSFDDV